MHLSHNKPVQHYRLRKECLGSGPAQKNLGILVNSQLKLSQECIQAAKKANGILACVSNGVASRTREVIVPLYSALLRPNPKLFVQFWATHDKKDTEVLEQDQRRATKMLKGLKIISQEKRMRELGLFTLEKGTSNRLRGDSLKLHQGQFSLSMGMNLFIERVGKHWNGVPREVVDSPSLEVFKK
ncbi:hypothetical protein BTVI_43465 [Pitangus sulphuratus]|nr:hypothetical protein BTVI_43465 [Pitangus sulphuratus]